MAYLIDGNNFLGFSFPASHRDPKNRYELIWKLLTFQSITRARVFLVFDGALPADHPVIKGQRKKFEVLFPAQGQNADALIKDIISRQTDLRRFYVVSSDREIKSFAQTKGAKPLSCKEFNSELKKALKENKKTLELEKNAVFPTSLEVELWLEVFKNKK